MFEEVVGLKWRNTYLFYDATGAEYEEFEVLKRIETQTKNSEFVFKVLRTFHLMKIEQTIEIWTIQEIVEEYSRWLLIDMIKNETHRLQDTDIQILKKYYNEDFEEEE